MSLSIYHNVRATGLQTENGSLLRYIGWFSLARSKRYVAANCFLQSLTRANLCETKLQHCSCASCFTAVQKLALLSGTSPWIPLRGPSCRWRFHAWTWITEPSFRTRRIRKRHNEKIDSRRQDGGKSSFLLFLAVLLS